MAKYIHLFSNLYILSPLHPRSQLLDGAASAADFDSVVEPLSSCFYLCESANCQNLFLYDILFLFHTF